MVSPKKTNKMKNKKNTWWNRLIHKKEVKANTEQKERAERVISLAPGYIQKIGVVSYTEGNLDSVKVTGVTSLLDILAIHKEAWSQGFKNEKIGPDSCGMYRCESIEALSPSQVFLGGIFGLNTNNIEFWERYKNEGKSGGGFNIYDYLTVYQIILSQYKRQLSSNIRAIAEKAEKELAQLKELGY